MAQIDEILPQRIEAGGCGLAEVTNLGSDLSDVAIGGTGENPGCRSVSLGRP